MSKFLKTKDAIILFEHKFFHIVRTPKWFHSLKVVCREWGENVYKETLFSNAKVDISKIKENIEYIDNFLKENEAEKYIDGYWFTKLSEDKKKEFANKILEIWHTDNFEKFEIEDFDENWNSEKFLNLVYKPLITLWLKEEFGWFTIEVPLPKISDALWIEFENKEQERRFNSKLEHLYEKKETFGKFSYSRVEEYDRKKIWEFIISKILENKKIKEIFEHNHIELYIHNLTLENSYLFSKRVFVLEVNISMRRKNTFNDKNSLNLFFPTAKNENEAIYQFSQANYDWKNVKEVKTFMENEEKINLLKIEEIIKTDKNFPTSFFVFQYDWDNLIEDRLNILRSTWITKEVYRNFVNSVLKKEVWVDNYEVFINMKSKDFYELKHKQQFLEMMFFNKEIQNIRSRYKLNSLSFSYEIPKDYSRTISIDKNYWKSFDFIFWDKLKDFINSEKVHSFITENFIDEFKYIEDKFNISLKRDWENLNVSLKDWQATNFNGQKFEKEEVFQDLILPLANLWEYSTENIFKAYDEIILWKNLEKYWRREMVNNENEKEIVFESHMVLFILGSVLDKIEQIWEIKFTFDNCLFKFWLEKSIFDENHWGNKILKKLAQTDEFKNFFKERFKDELDFKKQLIAYSNENFENAFHRQDFVGNTETLLWRR